MSKITQGLPEILDEANSQANLGMVYEAPDGRRYRYIKAGAAALVAGDLLQSAAQDTADQDITPTATAVGALSIVTSSTMTVTANQYAGGYVTVTVTPGLAMTYRIKSHSAYTAAAATFNLEEPIRVALTTSSRLDFVPNPYNGVIQAPTTLTSSVAGVAVNDVTANQFGWAQISGPCSVKNDAAGALTVGVTVMPSPSVAGAVRLATAGNLQVGQVMTGIAASENGMAFIHVS